jgi:hypothetical protein
MDLSTRKKNIFSFDWYAIATCKFELARRNVELVDTGQLWFYTYHERVPVQLGEIFCPHTWRKKLFFFSAGRMSVDAVESILVDKMTLLDVGDDDGDDDNDVVPEKEEDVVVISDKRVPVEVVDLSRLYGEGQRGVTAKKNFDLGEPVQIEVAAVYVAHALDDETTADASVVNFFLGQKDRKYNVCPKELCKLKGALLIALTGLLISKKESLARMMIEDGPWSMHGRLNTAKYATPQDAFPMAAKLYNFPETWTLQEFGKLYGVVQINAILAYSPLSMRAYGAGIFPAASFFNHSCAPNAIMVVRPEKIVIQVRVCRFIIVVHCHSGKNFSRRVVVCCRCSLLSFRRLLRLKLARRSPLHIARFPWTFCRQTW